MAKHAPKNSPVITPHSATHVITAAVAEREAAQYIGMSPAFLRAARIGRGSPGPPYIRAGRAIRYLLVDLDAWLAARRVTDDRSDHVYR